MFPPRSFSFFCCYHIRAHIKHNKLNFSQQQTTKKTLCKCTLQVGMKVSDICRCAPAIQPASLHGYKIVFARVHDFHTQNRFVLEKYHTEFKRIKVNERTEFPSSNSNSNQTQLCMHSGICIFLFIYLFRAAFIPGHFLSFLLSHFIFLFILVVFDLNKFSNAIPCYSYKEFSLLLHLLFEFEFGNTWWHISLPVDSTALTHAHTLVQNVKWNK